MKPKKDLIIFMPSIEKGGVEKNLFIISHYLSSKIKNIKLITTNNQKKLSKNITVIQPKSKFWSASNRYYKYLVCLVILIKLLIRNRNIVLFAFQANLYCTIVSKFFGIKIIVRSNSSPSGWSQNPFKKMIYKNILKLADTIIVNSKDFKKQFKLYFSLNTTCIYNPLNKEEIIKKSKEKLRYPFLKNKKKYVRILNIGRFTDQKDHITLLKAVNLIKNKIKFRLVIIGQGANQNLIENYIVENNLINQVKIVNFQKNPYKYLKASDIFILTSKYEGLPNVLLEAATLKKFIISTKCPTGPREILMNGKAGELVKMGDYKSISKIIILFDKDRKKFNKKINLAFNSLNRFDYNMNLKKYLKITKKYL